jgi:hypothetical protein
VNQATVIDVHNTTANVNVQPDVSDANRITSVISSNSDDDKNDKTDHIDVLNGQHTETDLTSTDMVTLTKEQSEDPNLKKYFDMVKNGNTMFSFVMVFCIIVVWCKAIGSSNFVYPSVGLKLY